MQMSAAEEEELYVLLRCNDDRLSSTLEALRDRLEELLYRRMSIAEMEALQARVRDS